MKTLALMLFVAAIVLHGHAGARAQEVPSGKPPSLPGRLPPLKGPGQENRSAEQLVKITATADVQQVAPGQAFHLAFIFEMEPHWHVYWRNAGAGGAATSIQVTAPAGFAVGKTLFPRPRSFVEDVGVSYGYEDKAVLFVEVTAPHQISTASVMFNVRINYMVCKDVCLLGRSSQVVNVLTHRGPPANPNPLLTPIDPAVEEFKMRLPKPLSELSGSDVRFEPGDGGDKASASGTLTIRVPAQGFDTAQFFPMDTPGVTYDEASVRKDGEALVVRVPVEVKTQNTLSQPMKISGTIGLGERQTDPCYDFDLPF